MHLHYSPDEGADQARHMRVNMNCIVYGTHEAYGDMHSFIPEMQEPCGDMESPTADIKWQYGDMKSYIADMKWQYGDMKFMVADMKSHHVDMKFMFADMKSHHFDMKYIIADMNGDVGHFRAALTYFGGKSPSCLAATTAIMSHRPQHPPYCSFVSTFILPCP